MSAAEAAKPAAPALSAKEVESLVAAFRNGLQMNIRVEALDRASDDAKVTGVWVFKILPA